MQRNTGLKRQIAPRLLPCGDPAARRARRSGPAAAGRRPRKTLHQLREGLIRGVVDRRVAEPAFLELACSAGTTWQEIRASRKTTAGQVGIAGTQLAKVTVPLPPLDVQRQVVQECGRQLVAADALEATLNRSLAEATDLKQAVLREAVTPLVANTGRAAKCKE